MFRRLLVKHTKDKTLKESIKNMFGFCPKNVQLYQLALTHKSVTKSLANGQRINNERLEYLGDTVLSTIVADFLFNKYPMANEGFLTELRSKIVSRNNLNQLAEKFGLSDLLMKENQHAISKSSQGDALEALIGAVYLDKGYDFTKSMIIHHIFQIHINVETLEKLPWNYKSKLIDMMQKSHKTVAFQVIGEKGKGMKKQYMVEVLLEQKTIGTGSGYSIKSAEQAAAENAYKSLFELNHPAS